MPSSPGLKSLIALSRHGIGRPPASAPVEWAAADGTGHAHPWRQDRARDRRGDSARARRDRCRLRLRRPAGGRGVMDQHGGSPLPDHVLESISATGSSSRARSRPPSARASARSTWPCARASTSTVPGAAVQSYPGVRSRCTTRSTSWSSARTRRTIYAGIETEDSTDEALELIAWIEQRGLERIREGSGSRSSRSRCPARATHRRVRLRLRAERPPQGGGRAQGQHHEVHGRALPPGRPRGRRRERGRGIRGQDRRQPLDAARPAA